MPLPRGTFACRCVVSKRATVMYHTEHGDHMRTTEIQWVWPVGGATTGSPLTSMGPDLLLALV